MTNNTFAVSQPDRAHPFEYRQFLWGEVIYGTKPELQALGVAPDLAFPGEPGGPKRKLRTIDPRGLPCEITRYFKSEVFTASVSYPDRPSFDTGLPSAYPGVTVSHFFYADMFNGRIEAILAAGLVRADQLPGALGPGKSSIYVLADGTVVSGKNEWEPSAGAKHIVMAGKSRLHVYVSVSPGEHGARLERLAIERHNFEQRMWALPRPRPLVFPERDQAARQRRAQMRLVWSRPNPIPTLSLPSFNL